MDLNINSEVEGMQYNCIPDEFKDLEEFDPFENSDENQGIEEFNPSEFSDEYNKLEDIDPFEKDSIRDEDMQEEYILNNCIQEGTVQNYSCDDILNKFEKFDCLTKTLDNTESDDDGTISIDTLEQMVMLSEELDESCTDMIFNAVDDTYESTESNESILKSNNLDVDMNLPPEEVRGNSSYHKHLLSPMKLTKNKTFIDDSDNSVDSVLHDMLLNTNSNSSSESNLEEPSISKGKSPSINLDEFVLHEDSFEYHPKRKRKSPVINESEDDSDEELDIKNKSLESKTSKVNKKMKESQSKTRDLNVLPKDSVHHKTKLKNSKNYDTTKNSLKEEGNNNNNTDNNNNTEDFSEDDLEYINPVEKKENNSYEKNKSRENNLSLDEEFLSSLYVPSSSEGGKYYVKESCCPYCFKIVKRLDQHLFKLHADKKTVQRIQNLPKNCRERRMEFSKLRMHGNVKHNEDPTINKTGKLLVARRLAKNLGKKKKDSTKIDESESHEESDAESEDNLIEKMKNYNVDTSEKENSKIPTFQLHRIKCTLCPAYVSRRSISNHYKKYHPTNAEKNSSTRDILKECRRENELVHPLACERVKKEILSGMRVNDTFNLVRFDETVILYLNEICDRYDLKDQNKLIRTNARTLGQFLKTMQTLDPTVQNLKTCINSKKWKDTVKAVRIIAKFDDKKRMFESPSTAQLLGLIIKTVISVLKSHYNQNHDRSGYRSVNSFEIEFNSHWTNSIGSKIVSSQNIIKRHELGKTIPPMSTNDKNTLIEFLDARRHILFTTLKNKFTQKTYVDLMKCQMIYLQCANARRPCEVDRINLVDYDKKKHASPDNEHSKKLNSSDHQRLKDYIYMDTKGKKLHGLDGRIYLKRYDIQILDFLINHRKKAGIRAENPYLFAEAAKNDTKTETHLDAHTCMKNLADICDEKYKKFENRNSVTATGLRKYAATKYKSTTNGKYSEFFMRHLAHTKQTHDAHYRGITAQETAIVTNILETIILSKDSTDEQNNEEANESISDSNQSDDEIPSEKVSKLKVVSDGKKARRHSWRSDELEAFEIAFADEIMKKKYPSRSKIRSAMDKFEILKIRGESSITSKFQSLLKKWTDQ